MGRVGGIRRQQRRKRDARVVLLDIRNAATMSESARKKQRLSPRESGDSSFVENSSTLYNDVCMHRSPLSWTSLTSNSFTV